MSDKKLAVASTTDPNLIAYYNADVVTANDYYPFGSQMPGRKFTQPNSSYRYGFNGKENDNEIKGEGNQQDYGMRIYDSRLGRFLSVDPLIKEYPELTPYQYANNTPIRCVDLDGAEDYDYLKLMENTLRKGIAMQKQANIEVITPDMQFKAGMGLSVLKNVKGFVNTINATKDPMKAMGLVKQWQDAQIADVQEQMLSPTYFILRNSL